MDNIKPIDRFNTLILAFVKDLKRINPNDKDLVRVETFANAIHIKKDIIIRHFQAHALKDIFVSNILHENISFFIEYDFFADESLNHLRDDIQVSLFDKVKNILKKLEQNPEKKESIVKIFEWITMLCYYAYEDIGIDAKEKMRHLQTVQVQKK